MASGATLISFFPTDLQEWPAVASPNCGPQVRWRNGHPILTFDPVNSEYAIFTGVMPRNYTNGNDVTVTFYVSMSSAVTGTVGWVIEFERIGNQQQDIDADGFGSTSGLGINTVPATCGYVMTQQVNIPVARTDGVQAGEAFRIRVTRWVSADDAAGDAELHAITIKET